MSKVSISVLKKEECYGCRSCEQVCPKGCISILPDNEGFLYPKIEENVCVQCGICVKHCPSLNKIQTDNTPIFYGLRLKNSSELQESASGGVFTGLADYIIENNGVVFGCAFDENLQARHVKAETKDELLPLKKSKYVTSDTLKTYDEVAQILKLFPDKTVLYTGTPCQIHGLYSYLGSKPENLITADIICHGAPSQKLFDKYIEWLRNELNEKILYYGFRDKDVAGWSCGGKTKTKTKTKTINGAIDPYYSSFMRGETYRFSCYQCDFANVSRRPSDITMGDFWGVESAHPKFYSSEGVSCCIINTEKGRLVFEKIKDRFECIETTSDKVSRQNFNLLHPTKKPLKRNTIYDGIDEMPVEKFISKLYAPLHKRFVKFLISKIPLRVKISIKKFLSY